MLEEVSDEQILALTEAAQKDWVFHIKEVQGVETLEAFQETLIRAVQAHERVAIRSCHDMGKTWTCAKLVLAVASTYPGCKIVTTAPTKRQVELLLWSEIRAGHAASRYPLGGELGATFWRFAPDWWAIGFTTQKEASNGEGQANSGFQGVHSPELVFVIFDEATGIAPDVWKQVEGLLTSAHVKFVAVGNPTTKSTPFFSCFSDASYKKLHLSCFDSPNLRANGIIDIDSLKTEYDHLKSLEEEDRLKALDAYKITRAHLLTAKWVMAMALKWGLDHPLFVSKALGEFPEEDESVLMPLGVVEAAQRRAGDAGQTYIGVDVARFGGDKSIITRLDYPVVHKVLTRVKRDTNEVAGTVIDLVNETLKERPNKPIVITVDGTGIGAGVVDKLTEYQREQENHWILVSVRELHFGETFKEGRDGSKEKVKELCETYVNKKAHAFVMLSQDLKEEIALPEKSDFYLEELPLIQYKFDSKGRWVIESKDEFKKRTKRGSPDYADSLAIANYGRYSTGQSGTFTKEMAAPQGRTRAKGVKW